MGKTATAHHIALNLQQNAGYQILPIADPKDIAKYYIKGLAQVFVFDDLCGVFNIDQLLINSWDKVSSEILTFSEEDNHFRILVTCRLQITKNQQFRKLSDKLNMKDCNLLSKDLAYTNGEKLKIASCHMDQEHVHKLSKETISSLDMFPFLCDMFGKSDDKDMKMFELPIQYFEEQFDQMQYQDEECFLGLALLVIYNDTIEINVFKDESIDTGFKKIFKEVIETLELTYRPSKLRVLKKLDTLVDTYITSYIENNESIITSKHDIVFDSLSLYFGKKMTKTLVKYATPYFISDRIQFESLEEDHDEYTIMIPPCLEHSYFDRMAEEIIHKNFYEVFGNQQSCFKTYQEKFIDFFFKKKDILEILLHNRWPIYLSSKYGCSIVVQFLLEQKTALDLNHDSEDERSLEIYVEDSDTEYYDLTLDKYRIMHKNAPLAAACTEGHSQIVRSLVKYGYDIDGVLCPLFAACHNGHTDIVNFLLTCNCEVDTKNCQGQTALHGACMNGNIGIVIALLERGCCINEQNYCKETPLFNACKHGYHDVVNILLTFNCGIKICKYFSENFLHAACKKGRKDIEEVLIRTKCDVHVISIFGRTALHEACSSDYTQVLDEEDDTWSSHGEEDDTWSSECKEDDVQYDEPKVENGKNVIKDKILDSIETFRKGIVEMLLHNNVNMSIADGYDYTALHMAARSGYPTIVDVLLKKLLEINKMALVNEDTPIDIEKEIIPPFFCSSSKSVVNVFVQHNCNIHVLDSCGRNALHYASERGSLEMVEILYEIGCKIDDLTASGKSVLHAACRGGNEDIVDFFLKRGCDVDHADNWDETPLFMACEGSNCKIVDILIKYHCDVNKINTGGCNSLQKPSLNGHADIVDILLKNEININQADNWNTTPLFYACLHGNIDVINLLIENKCEVNIPNKEGNIVLHISCWLGHLEMTQLLLQNHSNIDQADNLKLTPLHLAATEGYNDIVEILIEKGCDINACDINGRNALHYACMQKVEHGNINFLSGFSRYRRQEHYHKEVVVLLLQNKCDANQQDTFGQMPLHLACETHTSHRYIRCMTDTVKLLLESGCDINKCDYSHRSPFLIACEKNGYESEEIAKALVENNCDVNIKDSNGQTALEICNSNGITWITETLLHSQHFKNEVTKENT
ncbi:ankyrin-3-like [Mytilus trossulus]|uniref:ankyrin-3-like n=1 Tax=Mytilus trossulus TaxID=6551 RepID=UPI003005B958